MHDGKSGTNANTGNHTHTNSTTKHTNTNGQGPTALILLRDAKHTLGGVHFSYDGHKAKAMKDIDRAIRELTSANHSWMAAQMHHHSHHMSGHHATTHHNWMTAQVQHHTHHATSQHTGGQQRGQQGQTPNTMMGQTPSAPMIQQTRAEADTKVRQAISFLKQAQGHLGTSSGVGMSSGAAQPVESAISTLHTALQHR